MSRSSRSKERLASNPLPRGPSSHLSSPSQPRKRHATVYDAVAGRISTSGFISGEPVYSSTRSTASSSSRPLPPEEVLFKRRAAPTRYEEHDVYFASASPDDASLPDSDLLKAIHSYAADYYGRMGPGGGAVGWRSLDETALLAVGVLVEEMARGSLGADGDLVLVEGESSVEQVADRERSTVSKSAEQPSQDNTDKRRKRRRLNEDG